jgi:hypothetical protein
MRQICALLSLACLALPNTAAAGLIGATVDLAGYYPDLASIYADAGNSVVGPGIEYPFGSLAPYSYTLQVDVSDDTLTITLSRGTDFTHADFNGLVLQTISGPSIASATIDPLSTFSPSSLSVDSGNRLLMNFADRDVLFGDSVAIIDLATVPEPGSFALAAVGIVAIAARHWRRR